MAAKPSPSCSRSSSRSRAAFALEPNEIISTAEHVAAAVRWRADRSGVHVEGNDLAVYRVADGQIVAAWFYADGYDPQALSQVFAFAGGE